MKFRLSKRILAAVMAAVASVSFSSAGTATLGAAAFGFTVQQAAAEEAASTTVAPVEGTEFTTEEDELVVDLNEENEENKEKEESKEEEQKVKYEPKPKRILPCTMTQDEAELFAKNFGGGQGTLGALLWSADVANDSGDTAAMIPAAESAAQATATGTTALPSADMGFTTDAYGRSAAEVAKGSAPEFETPKPAFAATGGALNLSTSTTGSSNASSSVATPAPTAVQNHLDNGYGYYQYGAPILRQATITTAPAMLGETAPDPSKYIFSFEHGGQIEYFSKQDSYNLVVGAGETGKITFSSALQGHTLDVQGDFQMTGEKFTIDTNGVQVTFAQAMSNYDTEFTVQDSSGGGKITALAPAAFQSLYVESGEMEIKTQIGVVDQLKVGGEGATLTVDETAKVILSQQVECYGGTINLNGIVDASNVSNAVAQDIGISFVDQGENPSDSGFLAPGDWSLGKKDIGCSGTVNIGDNARVVVALSDFKISKDDTTGMPYVHLGEIDKRLWFQNGGTLESPADIFGSEGGNTSILLTHTQESPEVEVNVDVQIREECVVYVAQNTEAQIHLNTKSGEVNGSIGNLYLMNGSTTNITPVPGAGSQLGWVTVVGQDVTLKCNGDPAEYAFVDEEVTMNNLVVKPASTVSVQANILPYYGYYDGIDHNIHFSTGTYDIEGLLTMEDGYTFDFRHRNYGPNWSPVVSYDADKQESTLNFEETLARLTMGDEGALILKGNASFKASTVTNDSALTADGNLVTKRSRVVDGEVLNPDDYDPKVNPDAWTADMEAALPQVNGTMEITGGATLTALNEKAAEGAINNYTTRNQNFMISGGTVTVTDEYDEWGTIAEGPGATTVSNQLNQSNVINDKADSHGSLTLDNANEETVDLGTVYAKEGDIIITNKEEVAAYTVRIGANREVAAVDADKFTDQAKNAQLTVGHLLQAEGGSTQDGKGSASKVKADVVLKGGAIIDVSKAGGVGGLNLMGTLTINQGAMLSEGDMALVWQMEKGDVYDLAFGVTGMAGFGDGVDWSVGVDASDYFDNGMAEGEFFIRYSNDGVGTNGNNVGTVYLYRLAVPEPTTGTLSLLALCALAARRRRK